MWRSSPRVSSPLGLPAEVTTEAAALALGLSGPFPFHVIAELLLRVKTLDVHIEYMHASTFYSDTTTMRRWSNYATASTVPITVEHDEDNYTHYFAYQAGKIYPTGWQDEWPHNDEYNASLSGMVFSSAEYDATFGDIYGSSRIHMSWYDTSAGDTTPVTSIDENGKWWIRLFQNSAIGPYPYDPFYYQIPASLILSSGTHPFTVRVDPSQFAIESPTDEVYTITATEWYPYATSTGDPAWDTATGLPINGGPGA